MNKLKLTLSATILSLLSACAAHPLDEGAESVNLVSIYPDTKTCTSVGEVIGTYGNWITGDFTSNANLISGARNSLRNEAYKLGANVVFIEGMENTDSWGSLGISNTTIVGKAFHCK